MTDTLTLRVALNGTSTNPYHHWGLRHNPFPQLGYAEFDAAERQVARLGGEPIPPERAEKYIRETLAGFTDEFVQRCLDHYKPGEYVHFVVTFPRERAESSQEIGF